MTRIVDEVDRVAYHEGAYILHRESPGSKVLVKRCLPELPTRLLWRAHHKLAVKITCRAVSPAMKPSTASEVRPKCNAGHHDTGMAYGAGQILGAGPMDA
jgi:hypothetical protein